MSDWIEQYSAALDARDAREQAHKPYIDAYTKLADRTAAAALVSSAASASPLPGPIPPAVKGRAADKSPASDSPPSNLLTTLRADLATTQKARQALQLEVASLSTSLAQLQTSAQRNLAQITQLTRQKAETERRLRDREEEIRGKAKLVEETQDEMVSLQLQVNMAEQRSERLEKENNELVERWMKRMGEEAEEVNRGSGWS